MAKARVHFLCNNCGAVQAKWMGKCPDCGTWDALEEYKEPTFDARAERSGKTADEAEETMADHKRPTRRAGPSCYSRPVRALCASRGCRAGLEGRFGDSK